MGRAEYKSFAAPDETKSFENGKLKVIRLAGETIGRTTLEPGWKWSPKTATIKGADFYGMPHYQYQLSGQLHIIAQDGTEFDLRPGDVSYVPPIKDAWVVGSEPVIMIDWAESQRRA